MDIGLLRLTIYYEQYRINISIKNASFCNLPGEQSRKDEKDKNMTVVDRRGSTQVP